MSENNDEGLTCDIETGVCGVPGQDSGLQMFELPKQASVDIYYFTDPICSHCWALEPVLRRFEQQYGHQFRLRTIMGGLLEDWNGFADVKNGISSPADVAGHWREVGEQSRMPIDGSLWHDDPVTSSFTPSRVYKVIQEQDEKLALRFLRLAREQVFAFNRNIANEPVLASIITELGLDASDVLARAAGSHGQELLEEDFAIARSFGVRGFPTLVLVNKKNEGVKVSGNRSLQGYADALQQVLGRNAKLDPRQPPELSTLLERSGRLFSKEIEVMYGIKRKDVASFIRDSLQDGEYQLGEVMGEAFVSAGSAA